MKRLYKYLILWLSISSCSETLETDKQARERINTESLEAKKSIDKSNKQIEKWYKSKQADSLVNHLAENGIQFPPNSAPLRGKESVRKYWEQLFQFGNIDFSLQTQDVKANGPLAVELGTYSFKFSPNQNSPVPAIADTGNYIVYWEKINGDWKIVWDAPVSAMPLPQN